MYITVTRLHLKGISKIPKFSWYTYKSIRQLNKAPGIISAAYKSEDYCTYWTLTAWESVDNMRAFRNHGSHLKAMKASGKLADELNYISWEGDKIPSWSVCMQKLNDHLEEQ
ncbi:hypothetical protein [Jeotgalibacillus proteolyticus]|uniref:hypothetical protein n=1 Tax=Jeotgalibacillus proteolyticus TaxID=2082395 RepID=UPI003CE97011